MHPVVATGARGKMHSIGEAAQQSGVHVETIRYYERIGLIPAPSRDAGWRRRYDAAAVARLGFVRRARALGFGLAEIRTLLGLCEGSGSACAEVAAMARRRQAAVRARMADLARLDAALSAMVADCAAGRETCPALDCLQAGPALRDG